MKFKTLLIAFAILFVGANVKGQSPYWRVGVSLSGNHNFPLNYTEIRSINSTFTGSGSIGAFQTENFSYANLSLKVGYNLAAEVFVENVFSSLVFSPITLNFAGNYLSIEPNIAWNVIDNPLEQNFSFSWGFSLYFNAFSSQIE